MRALILEADPEIDETIKFRDRPSFVLRGNWCARMGTKDHLNVFLYDGGIAPDPHGIVTDGHDNTTARQLAIRQDHPLDERAFVGLIPSIVAMNRAGGWRRMKGG